MHKYLKDYALHIYHSDEVKGLTVDNGEKWCLFIHNIRNPLNSAWVWYKTEPAAENALVYYHDVLSGIIPGNIKGDSSG